MFKPLRRLYDWVLHWAETPYDTPALFLLAVVESSVFPVPPDLLLMALALSIPARAFRYAAICSIGSILGGVLGYAIGYFGYETIGRPIIEMYHGQEVMASVEGLYMEYGFLGVLIAAITPIPYKIFTISSGFFRFEFFSFLAASIIGRSFRFFLVAGLIWKFGPPIKTFIDKYFNLLTIIFMVLLVGGFVLVKYVL
jgi:membrane protein YqaA with SNARE-associated domain